MKLYQVYFHESLEELYLQWKEQERAKKKNERRAGNQSAQTPLTGKIHVITQCKAS